MTQDDLNSLFKIIDNYHVLFIAKNVGVEVLSVDEKRYLNSLGIPLDLITSNEVPLKKMFRLGMIANTLGHDNLKQLQSTNFEQHIKEIGRLPLNKTQEKAFNLVQRQASKDIRKQADRIKESLEATSIKESAISRHVFESEILGEIGEGIQMRTPAANVARELQKKTTDWSRDFLRISEYVMHQAFEEGKVADIVEEEGDDVLVYKDTMPGHCHNCGRAYLTSGVGSQPKIFKLSTLVSNGTNIGLKQKEWKPVVGPMHPYCFDLEKTVFLTNNGWKYYDEVLDSDLLMSYSDGEFKMSKIIGKVDYQYQGDIHQWDRYFVTPNHKMLAQKRTSKTIEGRKQQHYLDLKLEDSQKLPQTVRMVRGGFKWNKLNPYYIEKFGYKFKVTDYVEFMAWYLSEGSILEQTKEKTWEVKITQTREKYFNKILDCSRRCFENIWGTGKDSIYIYVNNDFGKWLNRFGKSYEKFIPQDIKKLDKSLLDLFLNTYLLGDGTVRKNNSEFKGYHFKGIEKSIVTISKKMMGDISELILKIGLTPSIQKNSYWSNKRNKEQEKFTISFLTQSNYLQPTRKILKNQNVRVGCFETEFGTLIIGNSQDKNMKPLITGNCRCTLHKVPKGYEWDPKTKGFNKPKKEAIPELRSDIVERLGEAKIEVKIGKQTFNVSGK